MQFFVRLQKMIDQFNYHRRQAHTVHIGHVFLGGEYPVSLQSMANTDTNDTEGSVAQCIRMVEAGAEIVRFTAQGVKEAENLKNIKQALLNQGCTVPLVADIHFRADAANIAAQYVEKVRINPGNYIGKVVRTTDYSEEEYQEEFQKIKLKFTESLNICKEQGTAIRIGVNHGSLSERMMNRWGDTPRGMVESCMEFLHICEAENFKDVVISMKASNTLSMVHATRLLVSEMDKHDMHYPLHLGVTEAGDGEDGRIKSSVGIGALLHDGIGDTIRVSLSEDPEEEIPVARQLVNHVILNKNHAAIAAELNPDFSPFEYTRRKTHQILNIGGEQVPVVLVNKEGRFAIEPDYLVQNGTIKSRTGAVYPVYSLSSVDKLVQDASKAKFLQLTYADLNDAILSLLRSDLQIVVLLRSYHQNPVGEMRAFFHTLMNHGITAPVILCRQYTVSQLSELQINAAADLGVMFLDGFGDGIFLTVDEATTPKSIGVEQVNAVAFGILQASRVRVSKTEFISCPGCGRTLFDLQDAVARVKASTSHLKGLKIAIMGCIVNGPGEMADADYGYVGAGRGKVHLYKKRELMEKNIDEKEAVDKLIELIKMHGDWQD